MVLPIIQLPDRRLRQPSAEIEKKEFGNAEFVTMLSNMEETMFHAKGVGIAGVQVGYCRNVFLALHGDKIITVINPTIVSHSQNIETTEEGCLSVPGVYHPVKRWASVRLKGFNQRGMPIELKARGYFARILQHETDHLNGILFVDRFAQWSGSKN